MRASVVILNWNTSALLGRFLPAMLKSVGGMDAEIIVADNASTDDSLSMLSERFPSVKRIPLERNFGFAEGYNRALDGLDSDVYVLVNSDVDVPEDWLRKLLSHLDNHPECGVCGPKLHALEADGSRGDRFEYAGAAGGCIDRYGYPFCRGRVLSRTEIDRGQYDGPAEILWVSGACLAVRRGIWEAMGGFDASFFAHMEEIDFCWRAQLAGWKVQAVTDCVVWHLGGGTLPQGSPFKLKLNFRNNLLLLEKNLAPTFAAAGLSPQKAKRKASWRIFFREILDGCAALAYLLTLHPDRFKAVWDAHKEYRGMRASAANSAALRLASPIQGYREDVCVLLGNVK